MDLITGVPTLSDSASFESIIPTPDLGHDGFASELSDGLPEHVNSTHEVKQG